MTHLRRGLVTLAFAMLYAAVTFAAFDLHGFGQAFVVGAFWTALLQAAWR